MTKSGRHLHFGRKAPNLVYAEWKKMGGKLWNRQNILNLTFCGLPCMPVQFYVYISKRNVCNVVTVPTKIYMCMHLCTNVYLACSWEVVGSSPTRGELFSRKVWLFQENIKQWKVGAVSCVGLLFRMLISRNKYVYIHSLMLFQFHKSTWVLTWLKRFSM